MHLLPSYLWQQPNFVFGIYWDTCSIYILLKGQYMYTYLSVLLLLSMKKNLAAPHIMWQRINSVYFYLHINRAYHSYKATWTTTVVVGGLAPKTNILLPVFICMLKWNTSFEEFAVFIAHECLWNFFFDGYSTDDFALLR